MQHLLLALSMQREVGCKVKDWIHIHKTTIPGAIKHCHGDQSISNSLPMDESEALEVKDSVIVNNMGEHFVCVK